jgi:hypothetical protein
MAYFQEHVFPAFTTPEQVLAACEASGLMTRTQHGSLGETTYFVDTEPGDYDAPMTPIYSDEALVRWGNAVFATEQPEPFLPGLGRFDKLNLAHCASRRAKAHLCDDARFGSEYETAQFWGRRAFGTVF